MCHLVAMDRKPVETGGGVVITMVGNQWLTLIGAGLHTFCHHRRGCRLNAPRLDYFGNRICGASAQCVGTTFRWMR
jgi:hypothetical protein